MKYFWNPWIEIFKKPRDIFSPWSVRRQNSKNELRKRKKQQQHGRQKFFFNFENPGVCTNAVLIKVASRRIASIIELSSINEIDFDWMADCSKNKRNTRENNWSMSRRRRPVATKKSTAFREKMGWRKRKKEQPDEGREKYTGGESKIVGLK